MRHVTIGGGFSVFGIGHEMKVGRGRRGEGSRGRVVSLSVPYRWLDWMGLAVGSEGYECTPLWRREGDGALANLYLLSLPISWPEITALESAEGGCVVSVAWFECPIPARTCGGCVTRACHLAPAPADLDPILFGGHRI